MPFYQCTTPEGLLSDGQKVRIANEITRIHCEMTGAPPMFVHVAFGGMKAGTCFSGAQISKVSFIRASWRAGRTVELKQSFLRALAELWARETESDIRDVLVSITEVPANNIMEFGLILPEPDAEEAWMAEHGFATTAA